MKSLFKKFLLFVFVSLFLPVFAFAQSPSLPHQFFGSVNFTDGATPNGFLVEAKINGSVVGSSITSGGNYGYSPNLLFVLDNLGVNAGKTVDFYVDGIKTNEIAIFANGNSTQKNLTVPASLPITPTPSPTPTGGSTGSSGATIPTTPITPKSPLSAAAQKVDINNGGDGKVDVLDFTVLMINWGSADAGNTADFNEDGIVDILDFTLLMIHWTG